MDLVGDVSGKDCIIVDDMIDTAGTLCKAANELRDFGAKRVFAFATHGLFNGPAGERIEQSALELVAVANTLPLREEVTAKTKKIRQLSVGKLLAATIMSVSVLGTHLPIEAARHLIESSVCCMPRMSSAVPHRRVSIILVRF